MTDLIRQIDLWTEEGQYQDIIDTIEALPQTLLTPELLSQLGRAYNNLAVLGREQPDRFLLEKALYTLLPMEGELSEDHCWNFRVAYAYYYLDREGEAIPYFTKALELLPGDPDTIEFLSDCHHRISNPVHLKPFRVRVQQAWEAFADQEAELRALLEQGPEGQMADAMMKKCEDALRLAFDTPVFELGRGDDGCELVLSADGDPVYLFPLTYFAACAPDQVREHWKISVGRSRTEEPENIAICVDDLDISARDIRIWAEPYDDKKISISLYCEKLLPLLAESEDAAYSLVYILTDQVLGEIAHMRYVTSLNVLPAPFAADSLTLDQLPAYIETALDPEGWSSASDAEIACGRYTAYEASPELLDESRPLRSDVYIGITACMDLLNAYLIGEDHHMNTFHRDGAVPGFFYWPLDEVEREDILSLRDAVEQAIMDQAGPEAITFLGGATGEVYSYLDCIVWDLPAVLTAAETALRDMPLNRAAFHTFRLHASGVGLKWESETARAVDSLLAQVRQWNESSAFSHIISAIEAIPEDDRDYELSLWLARAYDNLAILGDGNTDSLPRDESGIDRTILEQAVSILLSIEEDGHDDPRWNARMAYSLYYIPGREPEAISYAWRWADLAPDDPDAARLVEDCTEFLQSCYTPEVYDDPDWAAVEDHIEAHFGTYETVFHEMVSPDIHVDICLIPPTDARPYNILVTMGMGAHSMNIPEELKEDKLDRAELLICLPPDWKLDETSLKDERWYWPIRLLKSTARLPLDLDTWLGWGHTISSGESNDPYDDSVGFCGVLLTDPGAFSPNAAVCPLADGNEVNFYQLIPLYLDELQFKLDHSAGDLLDHFTDAQLCVVNPQRAPVVIRKDPDEEDEDDLDEFLMDDGTWHLETLKEKQLSVEDIAVFNHMAIYLRWCVERDLMSDLFMERYEPFTLQLRADPSSVDLRAFVRDELNGLLLLPYFNQEGIDFASYYYGLQDNGAYFPSDIDNYAETYFGIKRYHSKEFQDEAYLFIPWTEDYYQSMKAIMDQRHRAWRVLIETRPDDEEPSPLAKAMMSYLNCPCQYFPPMTDDDPITAAYSYARRLGVRDGFYPVLITADPLLWETLISNSDPSNVGASHYRFHMDAVLQYRWDQLLQPLEDARTMLMLDAVPRQNDTIMSADTVPTDQRFMGCWDQTTHKTLPLILAAIPVQEPWEIFAYLPFGGWNACPDTPVLMAVAKHWYENYGAVPAVMTHDMLEWRLPVPVTAEQAAVLAEEQYAFCPEVLETQSDIGTLEALSDHLQKNTVWRFRWD